MEPTHTALLLSTAATPRPSAGTVATRRYCRRRRHRYAPSTLSRRRLPEPCRGQDDAAAGAPPPPLNDARGTQRPGSSPPPLPPTPPQTGRRRAKEGATPRPCRKPPPGATSRGAPRVGHLCIRRQHIIVGPATGTPPARARPAGREAFFQQTHATEGTLHLTTDIPRTRDGSVFLKKKKRLLQGSNLRGNIPSDSK
jgi:hypothetical protein